MLEYQKPRYQNEAIIQGVLYAACKKAGLSCDLQYPIRMEKDLNIPDFIVIEHGQIICIVEVKDSSSFNNLSSLSEQQIERYSRFGVPVFILYSIYDILYLVNKLLELKAKFLASIDPVKAQCFEADKQNEKKWDTKIATAFDRFDETFPGYKFTNDQSLEIVAKGVRTLGLVEVLRLLDEFGSNSEEFVSELKRCLKREKEEELQLLRKCYGRWGAPHVQHSISDYQNRQDKIDEKLS